MIITQTGINEPKVLSGMFNPKAIGIATVTAMSARFEYGGSPDEFIFPFLEEFLKKKKEGVDILILLTPGDTPLHFV